MTPMSADKKQRNKALIGCCAEVAEADCFQVSAQTKLSSLSAAFAIFCSTFWSRPSVHFCPVGSAVAFGRTHKYPENPMARMTVFVAVLFSLAISCSDLSAQEKVDFSHAPAPASLLAPGTEVTRAALVCFFEGPAADAD